MENEVSFPLENPESADFRAVITSRDNPLIREAFALVGDKKARKEQGLFVAEGARLCSEAAKSGFPVERLFITPEAEKRYAAYLEQLISCSKDVVRISENVAEKLSDTKTPQGIFAVCKCAEKEPDFSQNGVFVLLSEIQDPGNLGTVLRTCDAMDVKGVLLCSSAEVWSPKVLRASMGCLFRLPIKIFSDTEEALSVLKNAGITTYASALSTDAVLLPEIKFAKQSCVLIGNEGKGLSEKVISLCDKTVMIPMPGRAESLNAASAAAILIYSAAVGNGGAQK